MELYEQATAEEVASAYSVLGQLSLASIFGPPVPLFKGDTACVDRFNAVAALAVGMILTNCDFLRACEGIREELEGGWQVGSYDVKCAFVGDVKAAFRVDQCVDFVVVVPYPRIHFVNPPQDMRNIIPVVVAGVLGIHGQIVAWFIQGADNYLYQYLCKSGTSQYQYLRLLFLIGLNGGP